MCLKNIMKYCAIAFAMLISKAFHALGASDGVIHLNHAELASPHEEIQQLALSRSSSSLQSEASSNLRASDETLLVFVTKPTKIHWSNFGLAMVAQLTRIHVWAMMLQPVLQCTVAS